MTQLEFRTMLMDVSERYERLKERKPDEPHSREYDILFDNLYWAVYQYDESKFIL